MTVAIRSSVDDIVLLGASRTSTAQAFLVEEAVTRADVEAYRSLRQEVFCEEQGLFTGSDLDDADDDPRLVVLVARDPADGTVLGGVRLGPCVAGRDIGWWAGSRLVVGRRARTLGGIGPALVRAACARAEQAGVLRFDATVQRANEPLFRRLGWHRVRDTTVAGTPHVLMRWPVDRIARLAAATKAPLAGLLQGFHLGGSGFVGDDGAPVPGSDVLAACDAILPAMVERDPEWAGWCGVLVNANDLAAMGAEPLGLLDAVAARDASFAARVLRGVRAASAAYAIPVIGGHTTLGAPASLSITALGRTSSPVPAGGGRPGHAVRVTADLHGGWRRGYTGRQWDSTSSRTSEELQAMTSWVRRARPASAKDVSMAGLVGTLGMLAEASGCGAVLDVADVPRPAEASTGDWLTCFPGFAMLTTDEPGNPVAAAGPAVTAACGELVGGAGVRLHWPDGELTEALAGGVTGLGAA
ncbi:putative N-acetyltransferase (TIGR04045 family) [Motilibacter rhizosphaerae]|uniref:Putative N-acetyltransferase (TIGR04045 family) n=1 Tax=Motilibacter rhizosphaerae TaxID=598652 RepID=A0A4Q7NWQ5_9ACTN|nr:MSMEG_0567/sll0787 family protein [Motilibacter rhizosphaerae]RZS90842.1 putative N-acetyltransferase (TIGR04045 family) [Motilibacter rhizosphaerae]